MKVIHDNYRPGGWPKTCECENCNSILEVRQSEIEPRKPLSLSDHFICGVCKQATKLIEVHPTTFIKLKSL